MKKILLVLCLLLGARALYAQIRTQKNFNKTLSRRFNGNLKNFNVSESEILQLKKEDSIANTQGRPYRFGKAIDAGIDFIKEAKKNFSGDTTVYTLDILSKNALTINMIFEDISLSETASLYVYNDEKTIIYGPVKNKDIPKNRSLWW